MSFVIDSLKKLDLAPSEFIVVGSGIMDVLGIREANDVDIVVSLETFEKLRRKGWKSKKYPDYESLTNKHFEAYLGWDNPDEKPNFQNLIASKQIVDGYNFVSLDRLLAWKKRFARPKNLEDIKLIEKIKNQAL